MPDNNQPDSNNEVLYGYDSHPEFGGLFECFAFGEYEINRRIANLGLDFGVIYFYAEKGLK